MKFLELKNKISEVKNSSKEPNSRMEIIFKNQGT